MWATGAISWALNPPDAARSDFDVYHKVLWNFGDVKAYQPLAAK